MKKGFTLIELLAVLTVMAIIALIATPIVLNIINDARISSNERSIELYGNAIQNAIADYMLTSGNRMPSNYNEIVEYLSTNNKTIKDYYNGDVSCATTEISTNGNVYLANCTVNGTLVNDFTYGKQDNGTLVLDHKKGTYTDTVEVNSVSVRYYYVYDVKNGQDVDATFDVWYDTVIDDFNEFNSVAFQYSGVNPINYHYTPDYEYDYKLYNNNNVGKIIFSGTLPDDSRKTAIVNYIKEKNSYTSVETN